MIWLIGREGLGFTRAAALAALAGAEVAAGKRERVVEAVGQVSFAGQEGTLFASKLLTSAASHRQSNPFQTAPTSAKISPLGKKLPKGSLSAQFAIA